MGASDFNAIQPNYEPIVLTDTVGTTIYTANSINANNPAAGVWRIKKEWVSGTTTQMGFPNGSQEFSFVWNNRASYTYK